MPDFQIKMVRRVAGKNEWFEAQVMDVGV